MRNFVVNQDLKEIVSENLSWERLFNSTILVTGASGILPSYMVETLLYLNEIKQANITVVGIIRNEEKARKRFAHYAERRDLILIKHDIRLPFTYEGKVDYVIHAAGQASPKFYGADPVGTLEGHVTGTANFLRFAVEKNVKCFLYFSSCTVYGNPSVEVIDEKFMGTIAPLNLRSCYPLGKSAGENLCVAYNHQYGVPFKILRIAHTYAPMMPLDDGRVFSDFVANILNNEDIALNSDGSAERPLLYISDAVRAYFKILLEGKNAEAYNVAAEEYTTILNLAQTLVSLYPEKNLKVTFNKTVAEGYIAAEKNKAHIRFDVGKLKNLGWQQRYSIREGFERVISSQQQ